VAAANCHLMPATTAKIKNKQLTSVMQLQSRLMQPPIKTKTTIKLFMEEGEKDKTKNKTETKNKNTINRCYILPREVSNMLLVAVQKIKHHRYHIVHMIPGTGTSHSLLVLSKKDR